MDAVRGWRLPKASKEVVVREEHHHTETRQESVPKELLDRIANLEESLLLIGQMADEMMRDKQHKKAG
jgi:hypothetical protein